MKTIILCLCFTREDKAKDFSGILMRIMTHDWAYGSKGDKLRGKELGLAISAGGKEADYQAGGDDLYTISELNRPFQATSNLIETKFLPIFTLYETDSIQADVIEESAKKYADYVLKT